MKPQNVKDSMSVMAVIKDVTDNASLEPGLLDKLKVVVGDLEHAASINDSKGINECVSEIAKAFLVM